MTRIMVALLFVAMSACSFAAERSSAAVREFKRLAPCPETGKSRGSCPGWIVDHIIPLCAGGADAPGNMQWQTVADAKAKDRDEHAQCRALRKPRAID